MVLLADNITQASIVVLAITILFAIVISIGKKDQGDNSDYFGW